MEATKQEQQILDYLIEYFLKRKEENDKQFKSEYWWKWVSTPQIAEHFGVTCAKMRRTLKKMEIKNLVHHGRISDHWLLWAPNEIKGYERHPRFKDYLIRSQSL